VSASDLLPVVPTTSRSGRGSRLAVLAGLSGLTTYVFLLDPDRHAAYPVCPSRALLGLDCPACGGLRGTNALLHGRVREALDHNLLLPALLGFLAVVLGLWLLPLVGRPERRLQLPRWSGAAALGVLAAFAVARNLPIDALDFLSSDA
jgi:hypothetical protein